jgi:pantoate kinase
MVQPSEQTRIKISIDGRTADARTSSTAIRQLMEKISKRYVIVVNHTCEVPIGAGYGTSGAGALGALLALNETLRLGMNRKQIVTLAHVAEVKCGTGYGDVMPQTLGGLVISREPGAPAYGSWTRISVPKNIRVVCGTLGPLPTEEILTPGLRAKSRKLGGEAMTKLLNNPTLQNFMRVSNEFAEKLGLLDNEIQTLIKSAVKAGAIGASMVMLGKAVFAFVENTKVERVQNAFLELLEPHAVIAANLDLEGARLVR